MGKVEVLTTTKMDTVAAEQFLQSAAEKANSERKRIGSVSMACQGNNIIVAAVLEPRSYREDDGEEE